MERPDLSALSVFAVVAAHGSFRNAARELGVSPSAVSHTVSGLEARLATRLLARTTRSVAVTDAGRALLARLEPALEEIGAAVEAARDSGRQPSGSLRLTVSRTASELVLVPILRDFGAALPQVILDIEADDQFADIVAGGFDAGIRLGESLQPDMVAIPIDAGQRMAVVASPGYFARFPKPDSPRQLGDHVCIRRRFRGRGVYDWEFEREGEAFEVKVKGALILSDDRLIIDAATTGAGLAFVFEGQVEAAVGNGQLVRVLEDWCPVFPGFFLYYPTRKLMRPALRTLIELIGRMPFGSGPRVQR